MTDEHKPVTDVDDLLRRACADDLPGDVADALSRRFDMFLAEPRTTGQPGPSRVLLIPKIAWAALSILMLLAGIILQQARVSSPLADRISSIKTAYASLEQIRR